MLVEHDRVEPHLLDVQLLVEVAVVEVGPDAGIVVLVADVEVGDVETCRPEEAGLRVLIRSFGEIADQHGVPLSLWTRIRVGSPMLQGEGYALMSSWEGVGGEQIPDRKRYTFERGNDENAVPTRLSPS